MDSDFIDLGITSLTAVELSQRLNRHVGKELPATLVYDSPTPRDLVSQLRDEIAQHGGTTTSELDL